MKIPYDIQFAIMSSLVSSISKLWPWRKEACWNKQIKSKIAALRFMRSL